MKIRAAVAWEANTLLSIEDVDPEGPKEGEVLVRIVATGVCHTDGYTLQEWILKELSHPEHSKA